MFARPAGPRRAVRSARTVARVAAAVAGEVDVIGPALVAGVSDVFRQLVTGAEVTGETLDAVGRLDNAAARGDDQRERGRVAVVAEDTKDARRRRRRRARLDGGDECRATAAPGEVFGDGFRFGFDGEGLFFRSRERDREALRRAGLTDGRAAVTLTM